MKNVIVDIKDLTDSKELMERKMPKPILLFFLIVFGIVLTLLIWAFFGEIEEYSTVEGKIRPQTSTNIISALSSGKIKNLNFENGNTVNKGDVILSLDIGSVESKKDILILGISKNEKKIQYNNKLKECVEKGENKFLKSEDEIEYYNQYEKYISDLEVSLNQIQDADNQNNKAKEETTVTLNSLQDSINKKQELIKEYNNIIYAVNNDADFSSENDMLFYYFCNYKTNIENEDTLIKECEATYNQLVNSSDESITQEQIDDAKLKIDSAKNKKESTKTAFLLEVNQKIDALNNDIDTLKTTKEKTSLSLNTFSSATSEKDIREQAKLNMLVSIDITISNLETAKEEYEMQLMAINDTIDNSQIKADASGQIVYFNELSVGNVIQSGDKIAKVIPTNTEVKAILYIPSAVISDIKVGQKVEYTIASISTTDYEKVGGTITDITADSFINESTGMTFYKAEATVDNLTLTNLSGEEKNIIPGMTVEAHIVLENKKIIIWLLEQLNFIA